MLSPVVGAEVDTVVCMLCGWSGGRLLVQAVCWGGCDGRRGACL